MKNIVDLDNFKCEKCGGSDYRYTQDFKSERISPSTTKIECLNCGHTLYDICIRISDKKGGIK